MPAEPKLDIAEMRRLLKLADQDSDWTVSGAGHGYVSIRVSDAESRALAMLRTAAEPLLSAYEENQKPPMPNDPAEPREVQEAVERLRCRHVQASQPGGEVYCYEDGETWPCCVEQVLTALESLREAPMPSDLVDEAIKHCRAEEALSFRLHRTTCCVERESLRTVLTALDTEHQRANAAERDAAVLRALEQHHGVIQTMDDGRPLNTVPIKRWIAEAREAEAHKP